MAEETSHYAVVAVDDEGRQLARLLDGYIAPQVARVMALLGVPDRWARRHARRRSLLPPPARPRPARPVTGRRQPVRTGHPGRRREVRADPDGGAAADRHPGSIAWPSGSSRPRCGAGLGHRRGRSRRAGRPTRLPGNTSSRASRRGRLVRPRHEPAHRGRGLAARRHRLRAAGRRADHQRRRQPGDAAGEPAARRARRAGGSVRPGRALGDRRRLDRAGCAAARRSSAGDFFAEVPEGDLHVLSNVLHDWEDDEARRIVANCHRPAARAAGCS